MKRVYDNIIRQHLREHRQMVFLSGPRQVGKTTTARTAAPKALYVNWDEPDDRRMILRGSRALAEALDLSAVQRRRPVLALDEIHKYSKWKSLLKGFFDAYGEQCRVVVTGSARLSIYKRGGDSLMGRYFPYRMHPLSIREIADPAAPNRPIRRPRPVARETMDHLLRFGGFPEPFLKGSERFHRRWQALRTELLFREDVRDTTRVMDTGQMQALAELLAEQAGQLVNYSSLAVQIRVSVDTIRRWIATLESFYYCFTVRPWHRNLAKSLRKQPKAYLWDWSCVAGAGARWENFIAAHLLKAAHAWTDLGLGRFELAYLRDTTGREVDFVVIRDGRPWFLVEAKSGSRRELNPALGHMQAQIGAPLAFQVSPDLDYVDRDCFSLKRPMRVPALTLLSQLV